MTEICIPKLLAKMDGTFGCKIVVKKTNDGAQKISFEKKTVLDLICDFFSSREVMRKSRETAVLALRQIATQLEEPPNSQFRNLVAKYESTAEAIDFKEVRKALNISVATLNMRLPPVVYSEQDNDDWTEIHRILRYDDCREPDLEHVSFSDKPTAQQEPVNSTLPTYSKTKSTAAQKPVIESASPYRNTREQFVEIYRHRLGESIRNGTYEMEMVRDPDGVVSDDNLAALAETKVEIEKLIKKPFSLSIVGEDYEEPHNITQRLELAVLDYVSEHGKAFYELAEDRLRATETGTCRIEFTASQRTA